MDQRRHHLTRLPEPAVGKKVPKGRRLIDLALKDGTLPDNAHPAKNIEDDLPPETIMRRSAGPAGLPATP